MWAIVPWNFVQAALNIERARASNACMRRGFALQLWLAIVLLVVGARASRAYADPIGDLTSQLDSADYKIRLAAVLSLSKLNDPRAAAPLARALRDSDKSVRSAAAAGLGKLLRIGLSADAKSSTIAALTAAKEDKDAGVRKQVERALAAVPRDKPAAAATSSKGIYIDIGDISTKTSEQAALRPAMDRAIRAAFAKHAATWEVGRPDDKAGKPPTGRAAYHVAGSVTELSTTRSGGTTEVVCKVSMLIATFPEKSMFGFLSGGAKVQASGTEAAQAGVDCVVAVMEDLMTRKVIPTIKTRSGQ